MVRRLLLLIILCGTASAISAQQTDYYRIEISSDAALLRKISQAGLSVDYTGTDGNAVLEVPAGELMLLDSLRIPYNMLIDNLSR